jgi:hypothetical protein
VYCLLLQGLEAKILQKFFPLTGGLLSEDTYGFDISDKQPKVVDKITLSDCTV